jgi:hypothetical protein
VTETALQGLLSTADQVYPRLAREARPLTEDFVGLLQCPDNPLLDCIQTVLGSRLKGAAAAVPESRLLAAARAAVKSREKTRELEFVGTDELRETDTYERLILLGPARWYPDHVFSAPRAAEIHVVSYRWNQNRWRPRTWLIGAARESKATVEDDIAEDEASIDEDLPSIDWAEIERGAREILGGDDRQTGHWDDDQQMGHDEIEVRLIALHGGYAVFLEGHEGSSCMVIDLAEDERSRVKRIAIADIEPGMFVLLRTEGGGDYVVPVADRILGPRAEECRRAQREWKSRLKTAISVHGLSEVARRLGAMGARLADEGNVRHWLSGRAIATQEKDDFAAIMQLVGLEGDLDRYWTLMRTIRAAHLKAGMAIRRRLLERVRAANLRELRKEGRLDFVLPEAEGGKLSAFKVEGRAPTTTWVPSSRVGRVFARRD